MALTEPNADSPVRKTVFTPSSLEILRSLNDGVPTESGKRRVSNSTYMPAGSYSSQETVEIPEFRESKEALEFCEFAPTRAETLYRNYCDATSTFGEHGSLKDAALLLIDMYPQDAIGPDDDWNGVLRGMGMRDALVSRMLDPHWTDWRLRQSAKSWATLVVEERAFFLQTLDSVIQGTREPPPHQQAQISKHSSDPSVPEYTSSAGDSSKGKTISYRPRPLVHEAVENPPMNVADHVMLFRGGARRRLESIFTKDNTLSFLQLLSSPPGDFSGFTAGLYFTNQHSVARKYAQWTVKLINGNVVPVAILRFAIPKPLLGSHYELVGSEWRELVWKSRRMLTAEDDFVHMEDFDWLVGPLCTQGTDVLAALESSDQLETERLDDNSFAIQYFTGRKRVFWDLADHCVGKTWIEPVALR